MSARRPGFLGLCTDLYELRMVESYLKRGMTSDATFSLYIRPTMNRPWFVALGLDRVLDLIDSFRYGDDEISYLRSVGVSKQTLDWLGSFEPAGEVWAVPDGCVVLGDEPLLEITAPLPVAQLLETATINVVQFPTLVATKGARVALAARGRPVVDFGFRRAQGLETGVDAAWAAYIGGGLLTSNVEAGRRFGIGVAGTMAHSFVQAHEREIDSFRAFAEDHPEGCVLLVDTYDSLDGVRNAIVVAHEMRARGAELRGVRLDSGDLGALAREARRLLDEADLSEVEIFASGGLDESKIADLVASGAPVDAFGVGTDLVVSMDRPAVDIAYKLVAYDDRAVMKASAGKASLAGAKQIFRDGDPSTDVLASRTETHPGRPLLEPVWRDAKRLRSFDMERARELAHDSVHAIPDEWKTPTFDETPPGPRVTDALRELTDRARYG